MAPPPGLGFGVGLVAASFHSVFFLIACTLVSRVISFIYDVQVRVVVSMFHETVHSVFVRERLLPCRVAVGSSGLYRVHGLRVFSL